MRDRVRAEENPEDRITLKKRKICRDLLVGFLFFMLFFTILSRLIDAKETPKVRTSYLKRGTVTKTVDGTGAIEAGETRSVPLISGLKPTAVDALPGTSVKEGTVLFRYTEESINKKRKELQKEIRKLELSIEQEKEGAVTYRGTTEAETAGQSLILAQRKLDRQNRKLVKAEQEYFDNLDRLKDYYDKRLELSEEELIQTSYNDYDQSRTDYESLKLQRDSEIRELKRKIKDTEKKIEKEEKKEEPDEDVVSDLQEDLDRYEEDLDSALESWDLKIDRAHEDMNDKGDIYDRAGREADSARLALKEAYENAVKQEEDTLLTEREQQEQAAWDLESASWALQNAKKNDAAQTLTGEQAKRLSDLRVETHLLELADLKEQQQELQELSASGGAVAAPCDGTVALSELEAEKELTGSERYLLSTGKLLFKGTFDREEGDNLQAGDNLSIQLEGTGQPVSVNASQVDLVTSADLGTVTAVLDTGNAALGQKASFESMKTSDIYNTVIPSSALRKDTNGWYCLAARKSKTILGEEYRAVRIELRLLQAGDTMSAVEGALSSEEPIITGSDRVVGAGDRVRPITD